MSEMSEHACPAEVEYDLADELLAEYEHLHPSADQVRGLQRMLRRCLTEAKARYPCSGATITQNGQFACPLQALASHGIASVFRQPDTAWVVPMETIMGDKAAIPQQPGAFL